jgi:nucleoside-diphosphate-sugar epimerase
VKCANGSGQFQVSWSAKPMQNLLIVQGTKGVLRVDLSAMTFIHKKSTVLPKAIERPIQGMTEGAKVFFQVPANAIRFVRKKILQYHGLQMLVEDFYKSLASGQPVPVSLERARPIVKWLTPAAEEADRVKRSFVDSLPKKLTAPILVTGASGLIGGRLVHRLLREDARVRILVRRPPPSEWMNNPNVEVVLGDLGDAEVVDRAIAGTEIVYHVGGTMKGGPIEHERGSVVGTRHVVESVRKHKVKKLIFISSLSVIWTAAPRNGKKITESWPLEPMSELRGAYTQAKQQAEKVVVDAVKEGGVRAVILRPAKVLGIGVPPTSLETAIRGGRRMVILGSGSLMPGLIYVEDLVDSIQLAAKSNAFDGSIFHIVDPSTLTRDEFARLYVKELLPGGKITHVPMMVMYGMAIGIELLMKVLRKPAPLSRYKLRSALAPFAYDCTAAEQKLGWKPTIGVRAGLAEIFNSMKKK